MLTIIDYKVGNLGSIENMFRRAGASVQISTDGELISRAEGLVLPGIGRFDYAMSALKQSGLIPLIEEKVFKEKVPILGICVGCQMMTQWSEEGEVKGLGWFDAQVRRFQFEDPSRRVPHMGWNFLNITKESSIFSIEQTPKFYFAHSYYIESRRPEEVLAKTDYGISFDSALSRENIYGVQFHPEKSHRFGLQLFENFAKLVQQGARS